MSKYDEKAQELEVKLYEVMQRVTTLENLAIYNPTPVPDVITPQPQPPLAGLPDNISSTYFMVFVGSNHWHYETFQEARKKAIKYIPPASIARLFVAELIE